MQSACTVPPSVLSGSTTFLHIFHIWHDFFLGGGLNIKCAFSFSLQILSATFPILTRAERDIIINVHRSSCETCYSCMKLEFSRQIFKKILQYQIT